MADFEGFEFFGVWLLVWFLLFIFLVKILLGGAYPSLLLTAYIGIRSTQSSLRSSDTPLV